MLTLADRVERVQTMADLYEKDSGFDRLDFLTDLPADAMRWSAVHGIDFQQALKRGKVHFSEGRHVVGLL